MTPNQLDEQLEVAGRGGRGVVVEEEQREEEEEEEEVTLEVLENMQNWKPISPYWLLTID